MRKKIIPAKVTFGYIRRNLKVEASYIVVTDKEMIDGLATLFGLNRKTKTKAIKRYNEDMSSGNWIFAGQSIVISNEGKIIDGEHRIRANIKAGYPPFKTVIVTGVPASAQRVIDQQVKRSIRDVIALEYGKDVSKYASSILYTIASFGAEADSISKDRAALTVNRIIEIMPEYRSAIDAVTSGIKGGNYFSAPFLGACVSAVHRGVGNADEIVQFLNRVQEGTFLTVNSPELKLREFVSAQRHTGGGSVQQKMRYEFTEKCLMKYLTGRTRAFKSDLEKFREPKAI